MQAFKACRNCNEIKEKVRKILEINFPKYRKIKCTLKCDRLILGGQGATNLLTGQITLNYDQLSELDSLAFTATLAHELLHCKDGYGLSHWGASDPDKFLYNPYHGKLDDDAYNDASLILDKVIGLFKCPECTP
ncbi:hypothetical protein QSV37_18605 [Acinetobacter sp. VNK23]|uniref:hypothetical protein n=1 Tax=Acinetobacter thutiue TaxID=2998078 RepID=UPI002576F74B|nr:hypothetical protein [Acinetobacter thutiue]MDM1022275.1 hypothetical protein [Acinetobacter thutiue]